MKIAAVELFEVEIPPIPPIAQYFPKIYDIILCRFSTDQGLQGWGEYQGKREIPVLKENLDWYRLLREKTHIPMALHLGAPAGVLQALKAECVDYVNLGGSALQVRKAAALAEAAQVPCWVQMGGLCLGVLAAYSVHLQSTLPNATLPCDELPFTRVADVLEGGLKLEAGHFHVPQGSGLGIKVDMKVVEKYRVA
ncbi:MAG: hypothetical protein HYW07_14800 [Candidatus Latescibacteria bacterium]|nr:hypothetical protein [Candidatus Latescibacterota bacterium]